METTQHWQDPISCAYKISTLGQDFIFYYSSLDLGYSGRYSFLGFDSSDTIVSNSWKSLNTLTFPHSNTDKYYGYLAYELVSELEPEKKDIKILDQMIASPIGKKMPRLYLCRFQNQVIFDHHLRTCQWISQHNEAWPFSTVTEPPNPKGVTVLSLQSNMTKDHYIKNVNIILEAICRGDLCQANLTRKFYGELSYDDPFLLFCNLVSFSASPYSAYLQLGGRQILSSSPERFLSIDSEGIVESRPIKGSMPRMPTQHDDAKARAALEKSPKDRSENLMIVDLMRHDLARSCVAGSVKVKDLFNVTSYPTIHHMASTISGQKKEGVTPAQVVQNAFPPGSMTGTPKLQAISLCAELEQMERGLYSGAIGYFSGNGQLDLSVVIRTLILDQNRFEFQVGGAIIAESDPEKEWAETLAKAKGITTTLGIATEELEEKVNSSDF